MNEQEYREIYAKDIPPHVGIFALKNGELVPSREVSGSPREYVSLAHYRELLQLNKKLRTELEWKDYVPGSMKGG